MGKFNISSSSQIAGGIKTDVWGFTLVELLVVISIVSVLISFLILYLNPIKQIQKARDAQKEQNLKQINNALDTYYNDTNCYPLSLGFASTWQQGSSVYMQKVPQDPDCSGGGSCYNYLVDSSTCPQWNILFAKVNNVPNSSISCPLSSLTNCVPSNYASSGYNYCVLSGKVDCNFISTQSLPANAGSGAGGSGGGGIRPTATPIPPTFTPAPTPSPVLCSKFYAFTGSGPNGPLCNNLDADPLNQCSIHGGTYTCYSISNCTLPLCQ